MANLIQHTTINSDRILIQKYQDGDDYAFTLLFNKYYGSLIGYFVNNMQGRERTDLEDLVQQVFIKIAYHLNNGYVESGKFSIWLFKIAKNVMVDQIRKDRKKFMFSRIEYCNALNTDNSCVGLYDSYLGTDDLRVDPVELEIISQESRDKINRCIIRLPEKQQKTIRLRYFEDMKFKDIANELNIGINTALGTERYALNNLRKMIIE